MIELKLYDLLMSDIVPSFSNNPIIQSGEPWWWPMRRGRDGTDWFYKSEYRTSLKDKGVNASAALKSLGGSAKHHESYTNFRGYWGKRCIGGYRVVLISDRPSTNIYPSRQTTRWLNNLNKIGLGGVHVTDVMKTRCEPRTDLTWNQADINKWLPVLIKELKILSLNESEISNPVPLLIVPIWSKVTELFRQSNLAGLLKREAIEFQIVDGKMYYLGGAANITNEIIVSSWRKNLTRFIQLPLN